MLFGKKPEISDIVQSDEFAQLVEKVAGASVEAVINRLAYKRPAETPEYQSLLQDHKNLEARYNEAKALLHETQEQMRQLDGQLKEALDDKKRQELARGMLEKNLLHEQQKLSDATNTLQSLQNRHSEVKEQLDFNNQLFVEHRQVFDYLKDKPRLFLFFTDGDDQLDFESFILNTASWEKLSNLHKFLVTQLKKEDRPATEMELKLLTVFLNSYNRVSKDLAELITPVADTPFDQNLHESLTKKPAEIITQVYLPGLINSRSKVPRKALVL